MHHLLLDAVRSNSLKKLENLLLNPDILRDVNSFDAAGLTLLDFVYRDSLDKTTIDQMLKIIDQLILAGAVVSPKILENCSSKTAEIFCEMNQRLDSLDLNNTTKKK